jgi:ubiquinol-cytochrome c reductase cytochrome c1 subunit
MRRIILQAAVALALVSASAQAAEQKTLSPPNRDWSFEGIFGAYDNATLKRGHQVYRDVCSSCHSMDLMAYRNLQRIGYTWDEVKAIAAEYEVPAEPNEEGETVDEDGNILMRPATPSDGFARAFANEAAARAANSGRLPPELTLLAKSRKGGADYLMALLTGFRDPPDNVELADGVSFNLYYPGNYISMIEPLTEDMVEYTDGTKATVEQMASDVVTFMAWASDPTLERRKREGRWIILGLAFFSLLLFWVKRRTWAKLH